MVVINNRFLGHPDQEKRREFTEKSEDDLRSTFEPFGFKVRLERDVSYRQLKDLFKEIMQELESGKYSCLALWILR